MNTLETALSNIRYRSKFLLLGGTAGAVIGLLLLLTVQRANQEITANQLELSGMELYRSASPAFFHMMRHRGLAMRLANGDSSAQTAFDEETRAVDNGLDQTVKIVNALDVLSEDKGHWQELQTSWQQIRRAPALQTAAITQEEHNQLINRLQDGMLNVMDKTGISFEAAPEAYYGLMVVTSTLPTAAGQLGQLRAEGASAFSDDAATADKAHNKLAERYGAAQATTEDLLSSIQHYGEYAPAMAERNRETREQLASATSRFLDEVNAARNHQSTLDAGGYFRIASQAIDALQNAQETVYLPAVERFLHARANALQSKRNWLLAITGITIAALATLFSLIARLINSTVENLQQVSRQWHAGDLTARLQINGTDELAEAGRSLNNAMQSVNDTVAAMKQMADNMIEQVEQLAAASVQVLADSETQSESASSMAASVEELGASISQITDNSIQAEKVSRNSAGTAEQVSTMVNQSVASMQNIAAQVTNSSKNIYEMGEKSGQISEIIATIRSIADQTNLLALNAAIEAARAGEQGRGFSVVADEVRTLAARTSEATNQIAQTILTVVEDTRRIAEDMAVSKNGVDDGVRLILDVGSAMDAIHNNSSQLIHSTHDMHAALREQNAATQDVSQKIEIVASRAEESRAAVAQLNDISGHLRNVARQLVEQSGRFTTA